MRPYLAADGGLVNTKRIEDLRAIEELVKDKLISTLRAVAATRTLDELNAKRDEFAERRILRFLERGSPDAQLAAARALTHVGTLAAVERLKPLTEAWFAGELGAEAAKAIARTQKRHARAAPGALSVASGLPGELSLAAPAGAFSGSDPLPE